MAESQKAQANRLAKAREQRRVKREQTGDTPEAKAERRKQGKGYDPEEMKKRVGNPGAALLG
jgi:SOS response regulatory protein OraA/RecX